MPPTATQQPPAPAADTPKETTPPLWIRRLAQLSLEAEGDEQLRKRVYKILESLPRELCVDERGRQLPESEYDKVRIDCLQRCALLRGVHDPRSRMVDVVRDLPLPVLRGFRLAAKSDELIEFMIQRYPGF